MKKLKLKLARARLFFWQWWQQKKLNKQKSLSREVSRKKTLLKKLFKIVWIGCLLGVFIVLGVFAYFAKDLPDPAQISERKMKESTKIYDRTGKVLLYDISGEERRTFVPLAEIPQNLINATIATEDANFYNHFGFDIKGMIRGAWLSLTGHPLQSGSTLTQQFVKNSILSSEKTYTRKIKELILSVQLEIKYSKEEILELYLNQISYGSNFYGAEAAAQGFFGKSVRDINLAEATVLAALPRATTYYSPFGSHPEALKSRQDYILDRMTSLGMISEQEALEAKNHNIEYAKQRYAIKAPHFVIYIKEYLEEKYGQEYIQQSGLSVYTTLDWELQQVAQEAVEEGAKRNEQKYNALNASLVAIDPKTGQVLAMVGSRDYFDKENDGNVNVSLRNRQPGSSFKPFVYATALAKGFTPQTIVFDVQTNFSDNPDDPYIPQNYNGTFSGPVSLKSALAQSLNVPAVKALYLAGIEDVLKQAQKMGFSTLNDKDRFGLSLVLGGGEVKLIEEVAAYGAFATEGTLNETQSILKIVDRNGEIIEEFKQDSKNVLNKEIARQINNILSDNEARSLVFGPNSALYLGPITAAAKTGTTDEYHDAWTVGYTPSLVAGVWVGNNDNSEMKRASGLDAAAPIWNSFMKNSYQLKRAANDDGEEEETDLENYFDLPDSDELFEEPQAIETEKPMLNGQAVETYTVSIDSVSGKLATEDTPPELIVEKTFKRAHNILFYVDKDDPLGEIPKKPEQDPQYQRWEEAVQKWLQSTENCDPETGCLIILEPPTENDDVHTSENLPEIVIADPTEDKIITQDSVFIFTEVKDPQTIKQVDFFLDESYIGTKTTAPFNIFINLQNESPGKHEAKVKVYNQSLNSSEDTVSFYYEP